MSKNGRDAPVHECPAPGCGVKIPGRLFACREHWFVLPKPLRDRIWATYRPGQERDGFPSVEYVTAYAEAVAWLADHVAGKPA